jgi:hypothetical protein
VPNEPRKPGWFAELLLELFAALLIFVGLAGTTTIFIGVLWRVIRWAWS